MQKIIEEFCVKVDDTVSKYNRSSEKEGQCGLQLL